MKLKKQIIVPIVAVSALSAAVVPVVMATVNKPKQPEVRTDLFNIENGVLKGFKAGVTKTEIAEYAKEGVLCLPACETIGSYAFKGLNAPFVKQIVIDSSTKNIEDYSFYGSSAKEVSFSIAGQSDLKFIGNHAFAQCEELLAFPFPKGFETISDYAFMGCKKLRTLDFSMFVNESELFDATNKEAINNIKLGKACFSGVLPDPTTVTSDPLTIVVGKFDKTSLGCDEATYGSRYVLSDFASSIQLKIDYLGSQKPNWIVGRSPVSNFDICTVVPSNYLDIDSNGQVKGTTKEGQQALQFLKYSAIQFPKTAATFSADFWKDPGIESIKGSITDLDFYESSIAAIPENFLYDQETGEVLSNLENVRLGTATETIGSQAFFSAGTSKLKWININSSSLANIGEKAFAGNRNLCSFGDNPSTQAEQESQEFVIDYSREKTLTIGKEAFDNTGIYNIVFKNVNPNSTPTSIRYGEGAFAALEHLTSITFDNFIFGATYDSGANTITIGNNDNASAVIKSIFSHTSEESIFDGSFLNESGKCFIKVPSWSSEDVQNVYADVDYFKDINPQSPTINNNNLEQSLQDYFIAGMSTEEVLNFANWEIRGSESEGLNFEETHDDGIKSVEAAKPVEGQEFNFVVDFNAAPSTIDRLNTNVTISESNGKNKTTIVDWSLWTDEAGNQATIAIPGKYVTGDISVILASQTRLQVSGSSIDTSKSDECFAKPTIKQTNVSEGEDITISTSTAEKIDLSTELTEINVAGKTISYDATGVGGWFFTHDGNQFAITIPGWCNIWQTSTPAIAVTLKRVPAPAVDYALTANFDESAFVTGKTPKVAQTITSGTQPLFDISGAELKATHGYVTTGFNLQIVDINDPSTIHDTIALEYNESKGTLSSSRSIPTFDNAKAILNIPTALIHAVGHSQAEGITWDSNNPDVILEGQPVTFRLDLSGGVTVDLSASTIEVNKGEPMVIQDLINAKKIETKEDTNFIDIIINNQGAPELTIGDIQFTFVAKV